jgi:hypothetical protein
MTRRSLLTTAATVALVPGLPATLLAQQGKAPADPTEACRLLIERSRMTDQGQMLLQRLMRATETPALIDRLVHLANSVGGGDIVAGLTRMLETVERVEKQGSSTAPSK